MFSLGCSAITPSQVRSSQLFSAPLMRAAQRAVRPEVPPPPRLPTKRGTVSTRRSVPAHIPRPPYSASGIAEDVPWTHPLLPMPPKDIPAMRASCQLARHVLEFAGSLVKAGIKTDEIDAQVHDLIVKHGAYPSPLNYNKFPKSCCTSLNEVLCHGIPDSRPLQSGDIMNIDITVYLKGFHGDCSATYIVGEPTPELTKLRDVSEQALKVGIEACAPNRPIAVIGDAIETYVKKQGMTVQPDFVGHGVGRVFHTTPYIFHVKNRFPGVMLPGLVFTIEPVICTGSPSFSILDDNWTAISRDGSLSAQFEHTILITDNGPEILTK